MSSNPTPAAAKKTRVNIDNDQKKKKSSPTRASKRKSSRSRSAKRKSAKRRPTGRIKRAAKAAAAAATGAATGVANAASKAATAVAAAVTPDQSPKVQRASLNYTDANIKRANKRKFRSSEGMPRSREETGLSQELFPMAYPSFDPGRQSMTPSRMTYGANRKSLSAIRATNAARRSRFPWYIQLYNIRDIIIIILTPIIFLPLPITSNFLLVSRTRGLYHVSGEHTTILFSDKYLKFDDDLWKYWTTWIGWIKWAKCRPVYRFVQRGVRFRKIRRRGGSRVVGEVLSIRGGGSRRCFINSRRGVVGEVLSIRGG